MYDTHNIFAALLLSDTIIWMKSDEEEDGKTLMV